MSTNKVFKKIMILFRKKAIRDHNYGPEVSDLNF